MWIFLFIIVPCYGYLNNWFPVVPISSSDFSNPKQIRILGKDFVLWKKNEQFVFQDDVCPHRCAPLSEGYIDKESNNLRCAYHGWEFNQTGSCMVIPQMDNAKQQNHARTCVKTYDTCNYGDLLWVYLGDEVYKKNITEKYDLQETPVFMRELPYGLYILLENFFDPAHIPFAHHKLQSTRDCGSPINVEMLSKINNKDQFSILFDEKNTKDVSKSRKGIMNFEMPCHYFLTILRPALNMLKGLHIFMVPIQEDKTRIFIKYKINEKSSIYKIFAKIPIWLQHMFTNTFLDSDSLILHKQEQYLLTKNESYHFNKEYYMPTKSDSAISLYKKWVYKNMRSIPFFNKQRVTGELTRSEILDRYTQHTKDCLHCRKAFRFGKKMRLWGTVLMGSGFVYTRKSVFLILGIMNYFCFQRFIEQFLYKDYVHSLIK